MYLQVLLTLQVVGQPDKASEIELLSRKPITKLVASFVCLLNEQACVVIGGVETLAKIVGYTYIFDCDHLVQIS